MLCLATKPLHCGGTQTASQVHTFPTLTGVQLPNVSLREKSEFSSSGILMYTSQSVMLATPSENLDLSQQFPNIDALMNHVRMLQNADDYALVQRWGPRL